MVAYADSSFLTKLYIQEPASPVAIAAFGQVSQSVQATASSLGASAVVVWISDLTVIETRNALHSAVFDKRISSQEAALALAFLDRDIASRLLSPLPVSPASFARATALSDRHTPVLRTRTLDLLHLAVALEIGADTLLSFDQRQRQASQGEGMAVLP